MFYHSLWAVIGIRKKRNTGAIIARGLVFLALNEYNGKGSLAFFVFVDKGNYTFAAIGEFSSLCRNTWPFFMGCRGRTISRSLRYFLTPKPTSYVEYAIGNENS